MNRMRGMLTLAALATLGAALPAGAEGRGRGNDGVPPGQRPPAGLCRVWIDGVPPGRQPRPTDCSTAVASVPSNGRVIWGGQTRSQIVYGPRIYDPRVYDPRVYDTRVYDPRVYDPRVYDPRVYDPRVYDPREHDPRVYDPRHSVYHANDDVTDWATCTRQVAHGVVRTVCHQHRFNRNKAWKHQAKHDKDDRDRLQRSRERDRDDRDRFARR
jgi:hypothetical protein